jgi:hypothetical protein
LKYLAPSTTDAFACRFADSLSFSAPRQELLMRLAVDSVIAPRSAKLSSDTAL